MPDGYGLKHAVRFSGRHRLGEEPPVYYGLVVGTHGDKSIDVVPVRAVETGTRFYDDVSSDDDPARDNVLLDSCPPPFSEVCEESAYFVLKDGHGLCYAVADMNNVISGPRSRFTPVEREYEISDDNFELVLMHLRNRKLQQDGSTELRRNPSGQQEASGCSGRRKLGGGKPRQDDLEVQDGEVLVDDRAGTGMGKVLEPKARGDARARAGKDAGPLVHDDKEVKKALAKSGFPDVGVGSKAGPEDTGPGLG